MNLINLISSKCATGIINNNRYIYDGIKKRNKMALIQKNLNRMDELKIESQAATATTLGKADFFPFLLR